MPQPQAPEDRPLTDVDPKTDTNGLDVTPPPPVRPPTDRPIPPLGLPASTIPLSTLPRMFGEYQLLEELGRGGMGVVYKARQPSLNRIVALKMIQAGTLATETTIQRFCQEAQAAAVLDHPNIVPVFEIGEQEGQPYFTMAYVPGTSLRERVRSQGLPGPAETIALVRALAEAIDFAHEHGIIHRDLKPENVLIDLKGRPRIVDFGLAKYFAGGSGLPGPTHQGEILGTPVFMAPNRPKATFPASPRWSISTAWEDCSTSF